MKKNLLTGLLILLCFWGLSQDLIITNTGDSLNCKIIKHKEGHIHILIDNYGKTIEKSLPLSSVSEVKQNYYNSSLISSKYSPLENKILHRRLAVQGGWSYRLFSFPENFDPSMDEYFKKLKPGFHLSSDFQYFFGKYGALSLKCSAFRNKSEMDNVHIQYADGSEEYGSIKEAINIYFLGGGMLIRFNKNNRKNMFFSSFEVGYWRYKNKANIINQDLDLTSGNIGFNATMGYDFKISQNMLLGLQFSFLIGGMNEVDVTSGSSNYTINLRPEAYENISRIDLSIGLRFVKYRL